MNALVIFDIDGTLFQTDRVTVPAVQQTFAAFGLPIPSEGAVRSYIGASVIEYHGWLAAQCAPQLADRLVAAADARELSLIPQSGALYPGAFEALETLDRDGMALAICSNGPPLYVDRIVDTFDLRRLVGAVRMRGSSATTNKRTLMAEIMRAYPGYATVVVGDREEDIQAAHANRALAVGAMYGFGAARELLRADATATSAAAIPGAVHALINRDLG